MADTQPDMKTELYTLSIENETSIKSEVPTGPHNLRPEIKDEIQEISEAENTENGTFVPVMSVTKEETAYTNSKRDLKLQKVTVTENISYENAPTLTAENPQYCQVQNSVPEGPHFLRDEITGDKPNHMHTHVDLSNEMDREEPVLNQRDDHKKSSKIPVKFKSSAEKVIQNKKLDKEANKNIELNESKKEHLNNSLIPKLLSQQVPTTNTIRDDDITYGKILTPEDPEKQFDKIYEQCKDDNVTSLNDSILQQAKEIDPKEIDSIFKEIVKENVIRTPVQNKDKNEPKQSKIPVFRTRSSDHVLTSKPNQYDRRSSLRRGSDIKLHKDEIKKQLVTSSIPQKINVTSNERLGKRHQNDRLLKTEPIENDDKSKVQKAANTIHLENIERDEQKSNETLSYEKEGDFFSDMAEPLLENENELTENNSPKVIQVENTDEIVILQPEQEKSTYYSITSNMVKESKPTQIQKSYTDTADLCEKAETTIQNEEKGSNHNDRLMQSEDLIISNVPSELCEVRAENEINYDSYNEFPAVRVKEEIAEDTLSEPHVVRIENEIVNVTANDPHVVKIEDERICVNANESPAVKEGEEIVTVILNEPHEVRIEDEIIGITTQVPHTVKIEGEVINSAPCEPHVARVEDEVFDTAINGTHAISKEINVTSNENHAIRLEDDLIDVTTDGEQNKVYIEHDTLLNQNIDNTKLNSDLEKPEDYIPKNDHQDMKSVELGEHIPVSQVNSIIVSESQSNITQYKSIIEIDKNVSSKPNSEINNNTDNEKRKTEEEKVEQSEILKEVDNNINTEVNEAKSSINKNIITKKLEENSIPDNSVDDSTLKNVEEKISNDMKKYNENISLSSNEATESIETKNYDNSKSMPIEEDIKNIIDTDSKVENLSQNYSLSGKVSAIRNAINANESEQKTIPKNDTFVLKRNNILRKIAMFEQPNSDETRSLKSYKSFTSNDNRENSSKTKVKTAEVKSTPFDYEPKHEEYKVEDFKPKIIDEIVKKEIKEEEKTTFVHEIDIKITEEILQPKELTDNKINIDGNYLSVERKTNLNRGKSKSEKALIGNREGRINKIVERMISMEHIDHKPKEVISIKEMPKKRTVSDRIALFENKSATSQSEFRKNIDLFKPKKHFDFSNTIDSDDISQRIAKLKQARGTYGHVDVPMTTLNNGHRMPVLALGTAMIHPELVRHVIEAAIDLGYRAFDTARIYQNEEAVGEAIKTKIDNGVVRREELFITNKLWSTFHRGDLVEKACRDSLRKMGLDYFDLYLIHNPMSFKEGGSPFPKIANVLLYSVHDYLEAWLAMEQLLGKGLVRSIGVSNFNSEQISRILEKGRVKPVVNQVECHPYLNQNRLSTFCETRGIHLSCYASLGSKGTPEDLKNPGTAVIGDPVVIKIADDARMTPAQLLIRYQMQRKHSVVVKTSSANRLWENLKALELHLSDSEMDALNRMNKNRRYFSFIGMGDTHKNYPFKIPF